MFNGTKQAEENTCIFASVAGVLRHIDKHTRWNEANLLDSYKRATSSPVSFGSFKSILGPKLEKGGFNLCQLQGANAEYKTIDEYYNFIRKSVEEGVVPIVSRKIYLSCKYHMITAFDNTPSGLMIHDVGDGSQREITEQEFKGGFIDNLGRELRIHNDFDTLVITRSKREK